jgi:hypothetical protein
MGNFNGMKISPAAGALRAIMREICADIFENPTGESIPIDCALLKKIKAAVGDNWGMDRVTIVFDANEEDLVESFREYAKLQNALISDLVMCLKVAISPKSIS